MLFHTLLWKWRAGQVLVGDEHGLVQFFQSHDLGIATDKLLLLGSYNFLIAILGQAARPGIFVSLLMAHKPFRLPIDVGDWFGQVRLGEEDSGHHRVHVRVTLRQRLETTIYATPLAMLLLFRGCRVVMVENVWCLIVIDLYRSLHNVSLLEALDELARVNGRAACRNGCLIYLYRALLVNL